MNVTGTGIEGVMVMEPKLFGDARGFFFESFNQQVFDATVGAGYRFVQDNQSRSVRGVLRGLHYQVRQAQGKLVRVTRGAIYDVAVDLRRGSRTFGRWTAAELSEENRRQLWIPPGCAHGFLVLSDIAEVLYKASEHYAPQYERCIAWDDAQLGIDWPLQRIDGVPILSEKDRLGVPLAAAELAP